MITALETLKHLISQKKTGWCGVASLQYAFKEQGIDADQRDIAEMAKATVENGVKPEMMEKVSKDFGFKTEILEGETPEETLEEIESYRENGHSIILDYLKGDDLKSDGHYVLYQGHDENDIYFIDPETGKEESNGLKRFISKWKDVEKNGEVFKQWALIIKN